MTDELVKRLQIMEAEWSQRKGSNVTLAFELAERAMQLTSGAGPMARALALRMYGNSLRALGRPVEALAFVTESQALFREAGDEVEWARTINASIPVLVQLDRNAEAVRAAKSALSLLMRNGQRAAAARLLNNMGAMYGNMGKPLAALDAFTRAEELLRETEQYDDMARTQMNRMLVLQQLGRHRESISVCTQSLRHWLKQGAMVSVAKSLQSAAIGNLHLGQFGKALRRFSRARALFESQSSPRDVAVCDLYIAACYLELNRYDQTIARTRSVRSVLDPVQHGFQHAWAHLYEGVALARTGRGEEARQRLSQAWRWFEERGHSAWAGKARLEEAEVLLSLGVPTDASRAAAKAARLFAAAHMDTEAARAQLLKAESSLDAGRIAAARAAVEEAYPHFVRAHMPGPTFRCLHLQGRIAMRQRNWETAQRFLTRAVATAEHMRATVQVSFRRSFLDDKSSAYADLVLTCLEEGRVRRAYQLVDLAKSRALVDELVAAPRRRRARAEAGDQELLARIERVRREYQELTAPVQLGPEQAIALRGGTLSVPARRAQLEERLAALWDEWELRHIKGLGGAERRLPAAGQAYRRLAPGAALVEYFAAGDRLLAFVSDRSGLKGWVDLGSPDDVRRTLELLQLNLDAAVMMTASGRREVPALNRNARSLMQDLYQFLWAPLAQLLEQRRSVVVIPHGLLHLVPFEALHDGQGYLVQQTEITLAPSRSAWIRCLERSEGSGGATNGDLVVGFDLGGALPYVNTEARLVAGALGAEPCLGQDAACDRLTSTEGRRVVHLAAHGEFRLDNPYFSTLVLADGPLTVADVATTRLDASLVVLSGCETGLSRVSRGEELMGMVSAFLQAGSASVLASRWRVDDQVTAELMERFYAGLLAGEGKAAALRSAQTAIAEQGVHPLYWAAFGLIGDGGRLK